MPHSKYIVLSVARGPLTTPSSSFLFPLPPPFPAVYMSRGLKSDPGRGAAHAYAHTGVVTATDGALVDLGKADLHPATKGKLNYIRLVPCPLVFPLSFFHSVNAL